MFSFLVVILLCYLLYDGIIKLVQHEGPFELVQWLMLGLCILYIPVIVFSALRAFKNYKESKVKRADEEAKQIEELAARKRRFYLDDDEPVYVEPQDGDELYDDEDESEFSDEDAVDEDIVDEDVVDVDAADADTAEDAEDAE